MYYIDVQTSRICGSPYLPTSDAGHCKYTTFKQINNTLWDAVLAVGEDTLHITTDEIGPHFIRSGAAIAMFLGGCPMFLIMMIGPWSSNAFLCYIQKQVK